MSIVKILVPRLDNKGGIANYYKALRPFLSSKAEYLFRGKIKQKEFVLISVLRLLNDYIKYCKKTFEKETKAVIINPSLGVGGFLRDGIYLLITPKKVKKIVFFRGWNPDYEKKIEKSTLLKQWLSFTFLRADHIIVLSSEFKKKIIEWGYKNSVSIETTIVDENLLSGFDFKNIMHYRKKLKSINILYLGNVSKEKGVWEFIGAIEKLADQKTETKINCVIAGNGSELNKLKDYVRNKQLPVQFSGYVMEQEKQETFKQAHLYIFPSAYEGMPNSVLEAMAFGLPVITTRVGGIPDFFEDEKMGLFLNNREPEHIADKIWYLLERPELMEQMSEYNYNYAKENFYASKVAERLKKIIKEVLTEQNSQ